MRLLSAVALWAVGVQCVTAGLLAGSKMFSPEMVARMPEGMEAAFYSLLEEYAPGADQAVAGGSGSNDKFKMFADLLVSVEKKIKDEKVGIYEKFSAKKKELTAELQTKLSKDTATIREVEQLKASTSSKLIAAKVVMDASITAFKKAEKQIVASKEHEANAKLDNARRSNQLLARNEETRVEALDMADEEVKMIQQVKGLVQSVKTSGRLCALCGDKPGSGGVLGQVDGLTSEELLKSLRSGKCNATHVAQLGVDFVHCLETNKDEHQLCKLCQPMYGASHVAAAGCHENKVFSQGAFMTKLHSFNDMWQKRCPKMCLCREDYSPVCGTDENTYSNYCKAKCVDVEVAYQGACQAKEGPGDEEAAQLANGTKTTKKVKRDPKPVIVQEKTDMTLINSGDAMGKSLHTVQVLDPTSAQAKESTAQANATAVQMNNASVPAAQMKSNEMNAVPEDTASKNYSRNEKTIEKSKLDKKQRKSNSKSKTSK